MNQILIHQKDQYIYISDQGLQKILQLYQPNIPGKYINWSINHQFQFPIKIKNSGHGSQNPFTLIQAFQNTIKLAQYNPALNVKRNNKWVIYYLQITWSFQQYYDDCINFGNALISLNITQKKSINILAFNAPQWFISYFGSIFANCLPIGLYNTNSQQMCKYICNHSQCQLAVVDSNQQLNKYLKLWFQMPTLKYIVLYNIDQVPQYVDQLIKKKIYTWDSFLKLGKLFKPISPSSNIQNRMKKIKPGNCCTIIYTSGTTGNSKGVILTHDNYTWTATKANQCFHVKQGRFISYLPLSHVAAQIVDIIIPLLTHSNVFFAQPTALQGTLLKTLLEVKPKIFFGVPRVWQKIQQVLSKQLPKNKIVQYIKSIGNVGTYSQINDSKNQPLIWNLAKFFLYNKIKTKLGLQNNYLFLYGAAPLNPKTRQLFMNLNIPLICCYGISQCAGPQTLTDFSNWKSFDKQFFNQSGKAIFGTTMIILNPDKTGNGQICIKGNKKLLGRNRFVGYFKNQQETLKSIDSKGFFHTGDIGRIDQFKNLFITGRIKQLLITSNGQNIPFLLIQNQLKINLPFLSNLMLIGDKKKYICVLLTMKILKNQKIDNQTLQFLKKNGSKATTIQQIKQCPIINNIIQNGIEKTNQKALSRSQKIQKYLILNDDFTIQNESLTPTNKLKRKFIQQKYKNEIQVLYLDSKL